MSRSGAATAIAQAMMTSTPMTRPSSRMAAPSGAIQREAGGEGGIRTLDTLTGITVFETARFNHSRTLTSKTIKSFPAGNDLIVFDVNVREMAVTRAETTAVIDDYQLSITVLPTDKGHSTARAGDYWCAPRRFNVLARVKFVARTTEGISSSA